MTQILNDTFFCSNCKRYFRYDKIYSVNTSLNPEYRDKILNDSILKINCPFCMYSYNIDRSFFYNDMNNKFILAYSSKDDKLKSMCNEIELINTITEVKQDVPIFNTLLEKIDTLNYLNKIIPINNWNELKSTIMLNEDISKNIDTIENEIDFYKNDSLVNFKAYLDSNRALLKHSYTLMYIEELIKNYDC